MRLLNSVAVLTALFMPNVPELLKEPDYNVVREGDSWVVRKPGLAGQHFLISRHRDRSEADLHRRSLPRLRLSGLFVRFDPVTNGRTVLADWTLEQDAQDAEADVRQILNRFAPADQKAMLPSTPIYMARLLGSSGHTAEENGDHTRFVIYLDPFRATSRLHAAATLIHELTHVERYRARGFQANRAAAVLPRRDFVLLGLADELAAYQAEASMVRSFLDSPGNSELRHTARYAMRNPELRWPPALVAMLEQSGGPIEPRRQVVLDLERIAGAYWDSRHADPLDPGLRENILSWYNGSSEWKTIAAERTQWSGISSSMRLR